jgi:hypothetical protein
MHDANCDNLPVWPELAAPGEKLILPQLSEKRAEDTLGVEPVAHRKKVVDDRVNLCH